MAARAGHDAGFDRYRFVHCALPELDLRQIDPSCTLLGRRLSAPIVLSGADLAAVAQGARLALQVPAGQEAAALRAAAPDVLLLARISATQLHRGPSADDWRRLEADALVVHLDPLAEALRPDGFTEFSGLLTRIEALCRSTGAPVVVEEAGRGLDAETVRALFDAGAVAVDVGGGARCEPDPLDGWRARMAASFAGWGLATADALLQARRAAPDRLVFAGGARSGIDVAKAVALGADLVGVGAIPPAPEIAHELIETLRVAMFCVGAGDLARLRGTSRLTTAGAGRHAVHSETLRYDTRAGEHRDITADVAAAVGRSGVQDGQVLVYSHHTTCAVRINENEPLLLNDFDRLLGSIAPAGGYEHDDLERRVGVPPDEPVNGHSHCRHLLLSTSETVPVRNGRLVLGRWQSLLLFELCSARARELTVVVTGSR
jgi:isopentenyl-diphosphate Delta-isomerase